MALRARSSTDRLRPCCRRRYSPAPARAWLVVRGQMGRLPRARLHRTRAPGPQRQRLEHDRGAARARRSTGRSRTRPGAFAFDKNGDPHFPVLCRRMLNNDAPCPVRLLVFDVLRAEGENVAALSYAKRRHLLERLELNGSHWSTPDAFDDGRRPLPGRLRQRPGGRGRQMAAQLLPARRARLDQNEEPGYWRRATEL